MQKIVYAGALHTIEIFTEDGASLPQTIMVTQ